MKINEVVDKTISQERLLNEDLKDILGAIKSAPGRLTDKISQWASNLQSMAPLPDTKKLDAVTKHNERFTSTRDTLVGHLLWLYANAYPEVKEKQLKSKFTIRFPDLKQVIRKKIGHIYDGGELDLALIYTFEHDKISNRAKPEDEWDIGDPSNIANSKMAGALGYQETYEIITKMLLFLGRLERTGGNLLSVQDFNITGSSMFMQKLAKFNLITMDDSGEPILNIKRILKAHGNVIDKNKDELNKANKTGDDSFNPDMSRPDSKLDWDSANSDPDFLQGRKRQPDAEKPVGS